MYYCFRYNYLIKYNNFIILIIILQKYSNILRFIIFLLYKIIFIEYNYKIYNKKFLVIVKAFKKQRFKLTTIKNLINIIFNY